MFKAKEKDTIANLAKEVASASANTCSILYFYQPECPDVLADDKLAE